MTLDDIEVGRTYTGPVDYKRGLCGRRKVLAIDRQADLVMLRMEVGANPPVCYVSHANMGLAEFATWAQGCLSEPAEPAVQA